MQFIPLVLGIQVFLSGVFWPVAQLPGVLRPLSYIMPLTYANDALRGVMLKGADFIGINNRNLSTFEVDLQVTQRLAPQVPGECTIVSESGIRTADDIRRVINAGAHAALIGESLMRAADPRALLQSFLAIAEARKSH